MSGHSEVMLAATSNEVAPTRCDARPKVRALCPELRFEDVYDVWFDFVWQSARRLGTTSIAVDDVVQDIFLVVHRRLPDFEARSSVKTWLFGITRRVVRDHRRRVARNTEEGTLDEITVEDRRAGPARHAENAEAVRILYALLEELSEDKREVFILAELEQMTAPEMADALETSINTVYSRLRSARIAFNTAVTRHQARDRRYVP